jgi:hypothetical protein
MKIGDKVNTPHGEGVIVETEEISKYENDRNAFTRYGVKLDDPSVFNFLPFYVERELTII